MKRKQVFRFPASDRKARQVRQRWDSLNGRYFVTGRVTLADGAVLDNVVFDGDSLVAVAIQGDPTFDHAALYQKPIARVAVKDSTRSELRGREIEQ